MTKVGNQIDNVRRTLLKAGTMGAGALAISGSAIGSDEKADDDEMADQDAEIDEPEGFEVEILQGHAPFPDKLAATFSLTFPELAMMTKGRLSVRIRISTTSRLWSSQR